MSMAGLHNRKTGQAIVTFLIYTCLQNGFRYTFVHASYPRLTLLIKVILIGNLQ